jgi:hypothetical protein
VGGRKEVIGHARCTLACTASCTACCAAQQAADLPALLRRELQTSRCAFFPLSFLQKKKKKKKGRPRSGLYFAYHFFACLPFSPLASLTHSWELDGRNGMFSVVLGGGPAVPAFNSLFVPPTAHQVPQSFKNSSRIDSRSCGSLRRVNLWHRALFFFLDLPKQHFY